ncbi:MAG TPA: hypothetical protein VGH28_22425 [Polyangiaceae bacterium]|jgi:hypothetical protein
MAEKPVAIADRLFRDLMAPLVVGGELRPGRPIGGKNALALGPFTDTIDKELLAHVDLGRVRVARRLAPVDRLAAPTAADWALAAVLHDLVQCAHPDLRVRPSSRLLQIATMTADRVAGPASVGEALARHAWFSRALEITRTDTEVSFWVGKRTFLGQDPPSRLLAWPDLRRVHVDKSPRPLLELPGAGGHVDAPTFGAGVSAWLKKTPLTDLATCVRAAPAFTWSQETLRLISTRAGRTLALRAQDNLVSLDVETALGRATKPLIAGRASEALAIVTALLGERTLAAVVERAERRTPEGDAPAEDAFVARAIGAFGATALLAANQGALRPELASAVRGQLEPWMQTAPAQTAKTLLGA